MEFPRNEDENVEFKQSTSDINSILETICAFLNKKGGTIYIGIDDTGKRIGVDIGKNTVETLSNNIAASIHPIEYPFIDSVPENDRFILLIKVREGEQKPYFCKGRAFIRLGKNNVVMEARSIESAFENRLALKNRFEDTLTDISIEEKDVEAIDDFYKNARENIRQIKTGTLFTNLKLEKQDKFNIAGLICFGKNPQGTLPQFSFRCGIVKKGQLISIELIEGNIFHMIEKTLDYVIVKMGNRFEVEGAVRKTVYDYPPEAIREAVINSLVHRDLNFPSSNYIVIYEDYLEIRNPGQLPEGLSIEQLKEEHPSIQRNRKIAHILYLAGYIEHWGTGTRKMVEMCRSAGLGDPEFIQEQGFFKVRFRKKPLYSYPRYEKAFEEIRKKGYVESTSYAKKCNMSTRTARTDLNKLEKQGFVRKEKVGRKTLYKMKY